MNVPSLAPGFTDTGEMLVPFDTHTAGPSAPAVRHRPEKCANTPASGLNRRATDAIVVRHGGEVHAANAAAGGAVFELLLPRKA